MAKSTFQVRSAEECWIQQWMGGGRAGWGLNWVATFNFFLRQGLLL